MKETQCCRCGILKDDDGEDYCLDCYKEMEKADSRFDMLKKNGFRW